MDVYSVHIHLFFIEQTTFRIRLDLSAPSQDRSKPSPNNFSKGYNKKTAEDFSTAASVGLPGLEPGKTGPESVVLPLHHSPIFHQNHPFCFDDAKILLFCDSPNFFQVFFHKKVIYPLFRLKKSKITIDFTSFFSFIRQNQVSLYFVFI